MLDYESDEEFTDTQAKYLDLTNIDMRAIFQDDKLRHRGKLPKLRDYTYFEPVN